MKRSVLLLLPCLLLLGACANLATQTLPAWDSERVQRVWVERRLSDNHNIDRVMVQELQRLGYEASSGPLTMMPTGIQAIVSYEDRWTWDITSYMIELSVVVRDSRNERMLASGRYFRPALIGKTPSQMAARVLTPIFRPKADRPATESD